MTSIRIANSRQGESFYIDVDGKSILAYEGETVATVLLAEGIYAFFHQEPSYPPSKLFCGMGTCHQCLITVDDQLNCLACQTIVYPGMRVRTSL